MQNAKSLWPTEAMSLAKLAFGRLKGSDLSAELDSLRIRSDYSSYDWNKRMQELEREFFKELEVRGLAINPLNNDLDDKLRLDLSLLSQELDPIKRARKRAEICSYYRLSKHEVEDLLKVIKNQSSQQELKSYAIDSLFDLASEGLNWLIPEFLPRGETIILGGSPKAGKSLLAIDAAFAIATGESSFLGQNITPGKVLLVSCDESIGSTKSKLIKRGFKRGDKVEVVPEWTIDRLPELEKKIEEYRPDVVVIDSLKRITHGSQMSENSAEFADNIYSLKELFTKYGCSGILIHHTNKSNESMGVGKLRGSSAIAGAVWGTWQIEHILKADPNNKKKLIIDPKDPIRLLSVFARDTEGQSLKIEFNPENNSWQRLETEEDQIEMTYRDRILSVLRKNSHCDGLSGREIMQLMGEDGNKSIYSELNRMVNKKLISCKSSKTDKRVNIYTLVDDQQIREKQKDSPPPIDSDLNAYYLSESLTTKEFDNSQQDSKQVINVSQQDEKEINLLTNENSDSVMVLTDSQPSLENQGGEGVLVVEEELLNTAFNDSDEIKVGDLVLVPNPAGLDTGDCVSWVGDGFLKVKRFGKKFKIEEVVKVGNAGTIQ
jgi:DNA-binding PadR family transcriptional regulator/KaiC/GvpD/RAD55 family RecA-like ATPase